jgi:CubicO group peptidase (beta-lactamase class C family)
MGGVQQSMRSILLATTMGVVTLLLSAAFPAARAAAAVGAEQFAAQVRARTDETLGGLVRDGRSSFAAAVFVQNGRVTFEQAYGLEQPDPKTPFSIEATHVDLNSIRKIFTATAVAKLINEGKIASIDDPINRYLTHFKLPPAFGHEVTIRQVATHTAGFDEASFGAGPLQNDPSQFFAKRFPGYFENVGRYSSYDSYGPRLLAYLVGEVAGKPYSRYVEDSILRPLGMNETFLAAPSQPPTHRVVAFAPKSPVDKESYTELKPVEGATLAGTGVSTMQDMEKFMVALLGPAENQTVITQPMRDLMFQVLQANGEQGSAHGLIWDALRAGSRTLFVHGGVGPGMRCMMALDLSRSAGIFYCYGDVRGRFGQSALPSFEEVSDQMLKPFIACSPDESPGCTQYPAPGWKDSWNQYLGLYVSYSRHRHGFSKLRTMIHPTVVKVEKGTDALRLDGSDGFLEISPGVFGNPTHLETFSFIKDSATNKLLLSVSDRPSVYERPNLGEDPRVIPWVLAVLVLIALSGLLLALLPSYGMSPRARLAAAAYALVVGGAVCILFGLRAFGARYFDGIAWPLNIVRVCTFLTIPACAWLALATLRTGVQPVSSWSARLGQLHLRVVFVSSILLILVLFSVQLMSFGPIT